MAIRHFVAVRCADDLDDPREIPAATEQVGELELLADRLQRLGELGVEQLVHGVLVGSADAGRGRTQHVGLSRGAR